MIAISETNNSTQNDDRSRNQIDIAADEGSIFNDGAVFVFAVVIHKHDAASQIDIRTDIAVSDIGQVGNLAVCADGGVFHFHEIADFHAVGDAAVRAEMGVWSDVHIVCHDALLDGGGVNFIAVSDC